MPVSEKSLANLRPFPPGVSGNPAGRPSTGGAMIEHLDGFTAGDLTEDELRLLFKSKELSYHRRAAANRALVMLERPDLADFVEVLNGNKTLEELRAEGFDTSIVKKCKERQITLKNGTVIVEREIELHDRSGQEFDRVADRTHGRPTQHRVVENVDSTRKGQLNMDALVKALTRLGKPIAEWPLPVRAYAERTKQVESRVVEDGNGK